MIRILIVDDQNLVRQGIKSLLDKDLNFKVIGVVRDGRSAVKQVDVLRPDIVLIDIEMPTMNGIIATKYINHLSPDTKVIVLSSYEDRKYVVRALMAGAKAYLLKDSLTTDLKQAIIAVNSGYSHIESRLLAKIFNSDKMRSQRHPSRSPKEIATEHRVKKTSNTTFGNAPNEVRENVSVMSSKKHSVVSKERISDKSGDRTSQKKSVSEDHSHNSPVEIEIVSSSICVTERDDLHQKKPYSSSKILLAPSPQALSPKPLNASKANYQNLSATIARAKKQFQRATERTKIQQYTTKIRQFYRSKLARDRFEIQLMMKRWLGKRWVSNIGFVILGAITFAILNSL